MTPHQLPLKSSRSRCTSHIKIDHESCSRSIVEIHWDDQNDVPEKVAKMPLQTAKALFEALAMRADVLEMLEITLDEVHAASAQLDKISAPKAV